MSGRRSPSATEMLSSFAPVRDRPGLAPASAYRAMLARVQQDTDAEAARIAEDPIDALLVDNTTTAARMEWQLAQETAEPFFTAPSSLAAAPGHYLGAALGAIGFLEQAQYVGIAALTAPLAQAAVPLPCQTLTSMALGLPHTHTHPPSLIPPAPPCPLPSFGMVLVPGALSVLVGGVPAARAGDVGMTITCVTLGPPFEIVLGSSNTLIAGNRAARVGTDMFFHDNPSPLEGFAAFMAAAGAVAAIANAVGQAADGNFAGAAMSVAQQQADAAALALKQLRKVDPGGPPDMGAILSGEFTVLVGGLPMPVAFDTAEIVGAIRGLGRRIANRLRANTDDGAPGRSGSPDEESCVGGGPCPRGA